MRQKQKRTLCRLLSMALAALLLVGLLPTGLASVQAAEETVTREERLAAWYDDVRLGTMYHWSMACDLAINAMSSQQFENYPYTTIEAYDAAIKDVDVTKWIDEVERSGAQYLTFASFHSTHGYIRPWHSDVPGFPQTERDFLAEVIQEAHSRGIKVVVYMTTALNHAYDDEYNWYDGDAYVEYAKEHHADWIQENYGRELTEEEWQTTFNFERSAYGFGAFTFDEIEYLLNNYDIDGLWFDALCNPTWFAEDQYPYYTFEYDKCTDYTPDREPCDLPGHNQQYTYDKAGYEQYYFYKRDIIRHVNEIDPWCVTFSNNFAPLLHTDIIGHEGQSYGSSFDIMKENAGRVTEVMLPEGVWNYVDDSVRFDYPTIIRQVVQIAAGGGAASLCTSPQREVARFAPAVTEFHNLLREFIDWSGVSWYDPDTSVGYNIPDSFENRTQLGGAYVMATKNEKTNTHYLHVLQKPADGTTVVMEDLMQPIASVKDLHTGKDLEYRRSNGKLYITVTDWSDYEKYGDTIIAIQSDAVTAESMAGLLEQTMDGVTVEVDASYRLVLPALPSGYEAAVSYSGDEQVISLSGLVLQQAEDQTIRLRLSVTGPEGNRAETNEISVVVPSYALPRRLEQAQLSVTGVSSEYTFEDCKPGYVIDGNPATHWHSGVDDTANGEYITLDLGGVYNVTQVDELPRQNNSNGYVLQYELYAGTDDTNYTLVKSGSLENAGTEQQIVLETPVQARYLKFVCKQAAQKNDHCSIAELNVWVRPEATSSPMETQRARLEAALSEALATFHQFPADAQVSLRTQIDTAAGLLEDANSAFAAIIDAADALELTLNQPRTDGSFRVLADFERETELASFDLFTLNQGGKLGQAELVAGEKALSGTQSLRIYNEAGTAWGNGVITAEELPVAGIGGIGFRLKASAGTGVKPLVHAGNIYEGGNNRDIVSYSLFDLQGNPVTTGYTYDAAWKRLDFTVDFDGYMFIPYTDEAIENLDLTVTENVTFGFHFAHSPTTAPEYYIDDFGVYYGSDMNAALADLMGRGTAHAVTVVGGTANAGTAKPGETVTVTAGEGDFCHWTAQGLTLTEDQQTAKQFTFLMPAAAVTLTATTDHAGGEATCASCAVCQHCGSAYGEKDPENHTGGTEVRGAKDPTYKEDGYTGDTHCLGCGALLEQGEIIPKKERPGFDLPSLPVWEPEQAPEIPVFTDVRKSDWYYEAVTWAAETGLMNGTGAGKFSPDATTTRAMVLTMLYRRAGSPAVVSSGDTWYSDARVWAMENGISDGTNLEAPITREQLAAMLYRAAGSPAESGSLAAYPDGSDVSAWAVDALIWATENGIVTGRTGGMLAPGATATRAETAAMFMRLL